MPAIGQPARVGAHGGQVDAAISGVGRDREGEHATDARFEHLGLRSSHRQCMPGLQFAKSVQE